MSNLAKNVKDGFNNFFTTSNSFMANFLGGAKATDMVVLLVLAAVGIYSVDPDMKRPIQKYSAWALVIGGGLTLFAWVSQQYAWFLQLGIATLFAYAALQNKLVEDSIKDISAIVGFVLGWLSKTANFVAHIFSGGSKNWQKWLGFLAIPGFFSILFGFVVIKSGIGEIWLAEAFGTSEEFIRVFDGSIQMSTELTDLLTQQGYTMEEAEMKLAEWYNAARGNITWSEYGSKLYTKLSETFRKEKIRQVEEQTDRLQKFYDTVGDNNPEEITNFIEESTKTNKEWNEDFEKEVIGE